MSEVVTWFFGVKPKPKSNKTDKIQVNNGRVTKPPVKKGPLAKEGLEFDANTHMYALLKSLPMYMTGNFKSEWNTTIPSNVKIEDDKFEYNKRDGQADELVFFLAVPRGYHKTLENALNDVKTPKPGLMTKTYNEDAAQSLAKYVPGWGNYGMELLTTPFYALQRRVQSALEQKMRDSGLKGIQEFMPAELLVMSYKVTEPFISSVYRGHDGGSGRAMLAVGVDQIKNVSILEVHEFTYDADYINKERKTILERKRQ